MYTRPRPVIALTTEEAQDHFPLRAIRTSQTLYLSG